MFRVGFFFCSSFTNLVCCVCVSAFICNDHFVLTRTLEVHLKLDKTENDRYVRYAGMEVHLCPSEYLQNEVP